MKEVKHDLSNCKSPDQKQSSRKKRFDLLKAAVGKATSTSQLMRSQTTNLVGTLLDDVREMKDEF